MRITLLAYLGAILAAASVIAASDSGSDRSMDSRLATICPSGYAYQYADDTRSSSHMKQVPVPTTQLRYNESQNGLVFPDATSCFNAVFSDPSATGYRLQRANNFASGFNCYAGTNAVDVIEYVQYDDIVGDYEEVGFVW
jgi:hypothetical protein